MPPTPPPFPSSTRNALLLGAALLVLGVRLVVVHLCAVPVPYVDEWTAIGLKVLLPWQQGTLDWPALWALHNGEHRLIASRVLELVLFILNGQWDPLVGMVVNGFVVAAMVAVWLGAVSPGSSREHPGVAGGFLLACLWALPFGYANLLWPLQSHFYLLLLGTVLGLREVCGIAGRDRVRGWVVAIGLALAVLGSAGGLIGTIAVGAVLVARVAAGDLPWRSAAGALAATGVTAMAGWMLAPPGSSLPEWGAARLTFLKGTSWPLSNLVLLLAGGAAHSRYLPSWMPVGDALQAIGQNGGLLLAVFGLLSAVAWAPFLARAFALRRRGASIDSRDLFHLAVGGWVLAALAVVAFKRATDYFVPTRYIDLILPAIAVNGWFAWQSRALWLRRIWLAIVGGGLLVTIAGTAFTQLPRRAAEGEAWMRHLRGYALHRDISRLENLAVGQLPNLGTDPAPLVALLDRPGFSELLVPELRAEPPRHGPLGRASRLLLVAGPFLTAAGLLLLLRAWWAGRRQP